jgi:hypothetical protein
VINPAPALPDTSTLTFFLINSLVNNDIGASGNCLGRFLDRKPGAACSTGVATVAIGADVKVGSGSELCKKRKKE